MEEKEILNEYRKTRVEAFRTIKECTELLQEHENADLYYKRAMATILVGSYSGGFNKEFSLTYLDVEKVKPILEDFKQAKLLKPSCLDYIKEETLFLFNYTYSYEYESIYDITYKDIICTNCKEILEQEPDNDTFISILNLIQTSKHFYSS